MPLMTSPAFVSARRHDNKNCTGGFRESQSCWQGDSVILGFSRSSSLRRMSAAPHFEECTIVHLKADTAKIASGLRKLAPVSDGALRCISTRRGRSLKWVPYFSPG
jgi:hypothetical protein